MDFPQEKTVVSDGSIDKKHGMFGLPLAAILCIVIVVYGLLVVLCIFMRQLVLKRRPLSTLESLHCCDCLSFCSRPGIKLCESPCGQPGKSDDSPCKLHLEWLCWAVPTIHCRLPESEPGPSSCCPSALPAVECPTSVRCCGLEIRRDARPGMVDASVSSGNVLRSPTVTSQTAAGRGIQHGTALELADPGHRGGQRLGSSVQYSQYGSGLTSAGSHHHSRSQPDSSSYSQQDMDSADPDDFSRQSADSRDHSQHSTDSCHSSEHSADSSHHSQHVTILNPAALLDAGQTSGLSTAA